MFNYIHASTPGQYQDLVCQLSCSLGDALSKDVWWLLHMVGGTVMASYIQSYAMHPKPCGKFRYLYHQSSHWTSIQSKEDRSPASCQPRLLAVHNQCPGAHLLLISMPSSLAKTWRHLAILLCIKQSAWFPATCRHKLKQPGNSLTSWLYLPYVTYLSKPIHPGPSRSVSDLIYTDLQETLTWSSYSLKMLNAVSHWGHMLTCTSNKHHNGLSLTGIQVLLLWYRRVGILLIQCWCEFAFVWFDSVSLGFNTCTLIGELCNHFKGFEAI